MTIEHAIFTARITDEGELIVDLGGYSSAIDLILGDMETTTAEDHHLADAIAALPELLTAAYETAVAASPERLQRAQRLARAAMEKYWLKGSLPQSDRDDVWPGEQRR